MSFLPVGDKDDSSSEVSLPAAIQNCISDQEKTTKLVRWNEVSDAARRSELRRTAPVSSSRDLLSTWLLFYLMSYNIFSVRPLRYRCS